MTNIIFHIIPDYESVSSSSSLDHNMQGSPPAASVQIDNPVAYRHNIAVSSSSSLYSVIGKACLAWTRPTANDNSTIVSSPSPSTIEANEKGKEVNQNDSLLEERTISCEPKQTKQIFRGKGTTNHGNHLAPPSDSEILQSSKPTNFSYVELKIATKNFSDRNIFGSGFFGVVYKGWIDKHSLKATKPQNGIPVAVKIFDNDCLYNSNAEWLKHNLEQQNYHPNLLRLVGYCTEDKHCILVYEFMHHGSLEDHLFGRRHKPLSWSLRMKVALGAAKGLSFLHNAETIHGNLQSSNIFLDLNYNAKLWDIELTKLSTCGLGVETIYGDLNDGLYSRDDYTDPVYYHFNGEFYKSGGYARYEDMLNTNGAAYNFGVVFLEIISGLRAIDRYRPRDRHYLVNWAMPYLRHKRKFLHVLDTRLNGQYSVKSAQKAAHLAVQCLANEAKLRPNMDEVVTALEQLQESIIMP